MIFYRINELANKQGKSLQNVAIELGFSKNYFYNMKNSKSSPSDDALVKTAGYFQFKPLLSRVKRLGRKII